MKKFEKLLIWIVPLYFLNIVGKTLTVRAIHYLESNSSVIEGNLFGMTFGQTILTVQYLTYTPLFLAHIVIGVWLFIAARDEAGQKWLWLFAGVFLGLWAAAFYILVSIYEQRKRT